MKIGYTRISIIDDNLELQLTALRREGCQHIYQEEDIEKSKDRPQLQKLLNLLRLNDVVVVWRLDRLAQSRRQLFELVKLFQEKKVLFQSLTESWADTTSHNGHMVMAVLAGINNFEHKLNSERAAVSRAIFKQHNLPCEQNKRMTDEEKYKALNLWQKGMPVIEVAKMFNVHRTTIYRLVAFLDDVDSKENKL